MAMEKEKVAVLLILGFVATYALAGVVGIFEPTGQASYIDYMYGPEFKKTSPGYEYPAMIPPTGWERSQYFEIQTQTTPALDLYYTSNPKDLIITLPNYPERNTNWGR
jgi:hypothetical protein